jgi:hypothetical protein
VKNTAAASPRALAVYFLLGLSGCGPQIPDTLSADDMALSEAPEPADPAAAGRLSKLLPRRGRLRPQPHQRLRTGARRRPTKRRRLRSQLQRPNTDMGCLGGACRVIGCTTGYCDLDDDPENGCESSGKACPR